MSGIELNALAQRMVDATDHTEAQRLKTDLTNGFYGTPHGQEVVLTPCPPNE